MDAEYLTGRDEFSPALALGVSALLREFNRTGVLEAADVHVAQTLGQLSGVDQAEVLLAAALAVRAPRLGNVFVDLASAEQTAAIEDRGRPLAWPTAAGWASRVAACEGLVATSNDTRRPLRLDGTRLYLDRYWREQASLARTLLELAAVPVMQLELEQLRVRIAALFPEPDDRLQRAAAACMALRALTVIAGGPGTGKTTTVARALALILEQAAQDAPASQVPLVALCAPTGKAATRLSEAVHEQALRLDLSREVSAQMQSLQATTIHRLLGWRGAVGFGGFRHGPNNRLPHDVVIVDETSMVSLSLMNSLLGAVRGDARLVLVGDPDQLTAIEAGAVLRDVVGPAGFGTRFAAGMGAIVARATGDQQPAAEGDRWFGDGVVTLSRGHRFGSAIADVADAIRAGDGDATIAALARAGQSGADGSADGGADDTVHRTTASADGTVHWITDSATGAELLRTRAVAAYGAVRRAAFAGDGRAALAAVRRFQLLCAHRLGPYGVAQWTATVEGWLAAEWGASEAGPGHGFEPGPGRYIGEPLLLTENDHELRLYNGDAGVVIAGEDGEPPRAVFSRDGQIISLAPARLSAVQPLYATTIHKSQGSQFETVAVVLPAPDSPILTRELLYTAVTRAERELILVGSEQSLRAAVARPVARATGLMELLWER